MKGAMIGAGYFAQFHAEGWSRVAGAQITAVADAVAGKARRFADRWGIAAAYESAGEMLEAERPDFVDIVTGPESHLGLVAMASERGIHVMCQKPMAPSWDECVAMVQQCRRAGVRLLIHENWRWQPWWREARRLLDQGRLGEPFQLSCQWKTGDGRGRQPYSLQPYFRHMPRFLVYEALVHILDSFRFLAGEIETVYCQTKRLNPAIRGEDWAVIQLRFCSGAHGLIEGNRISGPWPVGPAACSMCLEASRARLRLDENGRLWLTDYGQPERPHQFPTTSAGYRGDSVRAAQQHLLDCLNTGRPSESEGEQYLRTMAAVFACYRSADTGQAVPASPD